MTTITRRTRGTSLQGFAESVEKSSKPRIKFPQEGIGSITPRPRMRRFASVKMKSGIEIKNCAQKSGRRFGATWRTSRRAGLEPEERASNKKSESRPPRVAVQMGRTEA